jgi:hypothetical protein
MLLAYDLATSYLLVICWIVLVAAVYFEARTRDSSGLTMLYTANITILHLPGALTLLVPWYEYYPKIWTYKGLFLTSVGLLCFFIGILAARFSLHFKARAPLQFNATAVRRLGMTLTVAGLVSTFVITLSASFAAIPGLSSIVSAVWLLGAPGLCLYFYSFIANKESVPLHGYALVLLYPASTIVLLGFLGFGVAFILFLLCFLGMQKFASIRLLIAAPLIAFVGLSFFVNYLPVRSDVREAVANEASLDSRVTSLATTFDNFQWLDLDNFFHLKALDDRLNQNWLVGATVENLELKGGFIEGESLYFSLVAWVPRAIWINKPSTAGSGRMAELATGLTFDESTSVGIGHIIELYLNFGQYGVIFGMLVLGFIVAGFDLKSASNFKQNNYLFWVSWVLPGIAFTNVGGQFSECVSSAASIAIVAFVVRHAANRLSSQYSLA